jgi:hypothetical protein
MVCATTFEDIASRHGGKWLGTEKALHSAKTLSNKNKHKYAGQKEKKIISSIPSRETTRKVGYLGSRSVKIRKNYTIIIVILKRSMLRVLTIWQRSFTFKF